MPVMRNLIIRRVIYCFSISLKSNQQFVFTEYCTVHGNQKASLVRDALTSQCTSATSKYNPTNMARAAAKAVLAKAEAKEAKAKAKAEAKAKAKAKNNGQ